MTTTDGEAIFTLRLMQKELDALKNAIDERMASLEANYAITLDDKHKSELNVLCNLSEQF